MRTNILLKAMDRKLAILIAILLLWGAYIFLSRPSFNMSELSTLLLFLVWAHFAMLISVLWASALIRFNKPYTPAFYGFFIGSHIFMFPVHIMWYFDIDGSRTGGSTAALIFAVMPVWSIIFGGIASGLSKVFSKGF